MKLYPFQREAVEVGVRSVLDGDNILISSPTGCHAKGTGIRLADGSAKAVEDIEVGDRLLGQYEPVNVLNLCRGRQDMVRVVPSHKTVKSFLVNLDHYLTCIYNWHESAYGWNWGDIFDVKVSDYLGWSSEKQAAIDLIQYEAKEVGSEQLKPMNIRINVMFDLELLPEDDFYGFTVDGNHRYFLEDWILTHNSGKSLVELVTMNEIQRSLGLTCGMITSQREIANGIIDKGQKMGIPMENRIWTPQKFWNLLQNKRVRMPQVLIVDEAHHSLAKTWKQLWKRKSYEGHPVKIIGLTATPMRGVEYENPQWKTLFHRFHEAITITEAIKQTYLSNFYILKDTVGLLGEQQIDTARAQDQIAADAIQDKLGLICEIITSLDRNRPTVFITPTVAAANLVATHFKYHTNIPVEPIVGTTSKKRRDELMKKLAKNQVWCSAVNLMTEGIDIPEISRVVNLRPSVSPIPYVQGLGRGLRLIYRGDSPDLSLKRWCEYIDFTNNLFRFGNKMRDVLGIRFEENEHTYTPDLNFVPEEEQKMTIVDDYINFRYSPAEAKPITAHYEGQEIVSKIGSTTGNDWAIRLFLSGNKSDVYVLERTSGLWKKKTASLQPRDFHIELGSSRDEILTLGARMGRGFKQVADDDVTLGELLLFGLLRQLVSESRELTDLEREAYLISRKFLTLIPGPRILAERSGL